MTKTAFITGIAGQDGSYLSEYLLEKGYKVTGIVRRNSVVEHQVDRVKHLQDLEIVYGDLLDPISIYAALRRFEPDEIYNLAAQSHVRISSDIPMFTTQTNALGVLSLLDAAREVCPDAKFYQASSSEMFGNSVDSDGYQRETTPMKPVSPYGCAKLFGFNISRYYRVAHNAHVANGILFNHESPRRGSNFVTNKIVKSAAQIKLGQLKGLELGNLDSFRDWGHSYDYVRAMHLILNKTNPEDYVVATGITHSVRELCEYVFSALDLNYQDYVSLNPKFFRPQELDYLKGDSSKIKSELGWQPIYTFESLLDEMIEFWMRTLSN
jgi:GDPmannose 4,6-dehydratase